MDSIKQILNYGWVGSLISFIGLIAAILIYRASRIGPRPVFQIWSLPLLNNDNQALPLEVSILFKGSSVNRLTRTQIIFWNSGYGLLNGIDMIKEDPLCFLFDVSGIILNAVVSKMTLLTNKFKVEVNPERPNELLCSFDYLNSGDGAIIEVLHTAQEEYVKCRGTFRGVPKGVRNWGGLNPPIDAMKKHREIYSERSIIIIIIIISAILLFSTIYIQRWMVRLPLILLGSVFLIGCLLPWIDRRRIPPSLRPKAWQFYSPNNSD